MDGTLMEAYRAWCRYLDGDKDWAAGGVPCSGGVLVFGDGSRVILGPQILFLEHPLYGYRRIPQDWQELLRFLDACTTGMYRLDAWFSRYVASIRRESYPEVNFGAVLPPSEFYMEEDIEWLLAEIRLELGVDLNPEDLLDLDIEQLLGSDS